MSTHSIRAMVRQKVLTVADGIVTRIKNVYTPENAQQDGIYYWPEPLPTPATLVPDPLVLFKTYLTPGAATPNGEDEQHQRIVLLPATAQAIMQERDRANFLSTLIAGQDKSIMHCEIPYHLPTCFTQF